MNGYHFRNCCLQVDKSELLRIYFALNEFGYQAGSLEKVMSEFNQQCGDSNYEENNKKFTLFNKGRQDYFEFRSFISEISHY